MKLCFYWYFFGMNFFFVTVILVPLRLKNHTMDYKITPRQDNETSSSPVLCYDLAPSCPREEVGSGSMQPFVWEYDEITIHYFYYWKMEREIPYLHGREKNKSLTSNLQSRVLKGYLYTRKNKLYIIDLKWRI